jgi:hypothetical protein
MNISEFWQLTEATKAASGSDDQKQAELLIEELCKLAVQDILDYDYFHRGLMHQAYRRKLWDVCYIINGAWCSDDGFSDFRAWLIGQGQSIFERAIEDPESLVEVVEPLQETTSEALTYVGWMAYERKTGQDMNTMPSFPIVKVDLVDENPRDSTMTDEERDLFFANEYPRIWAKFRPYWDKWYEL